MSSERSIPHLRDIFGINGYQTHHTPAYAPPPNNNNITNNNNVCSQIDQNFDFINKKSSKKKRDNNKTLTSGDVKTLERHLSMKKTIRKKIMRDLQQAFVDDPNEFRVDNTSSEQLKAEIRADAFRFGDKSNTRETDNFLDMLRGEKPQSGRDHRDYAQQRDRYDNYDAPQPQQQQQQTGGNEKQSFWRRFTMKVKR